MTEFGTALFLAPDCKLVESHSVFLNGVSTVRTLLEQDYMIAKNLRNGVHWTSLISQERRTIDKKLQNNTKDSFLKSKWKISIRKKKNKIINRNFLSPFKKPSRDSNTENRYFKHENWINIDSRISAYIDKINQSMRSNLILLIIWSILINSILYLFWKILKESQITIRIFFQWKFFTDLVLNFVRLVSGMPLNSHFGSNSFLYKLIANLVL